jgi:ABC-type nitrate/sulfonate/bicarbonate transport system substrate-binding protein
MGTAPPQIAALKRKDIDGMVTDISTALTLEREGGMRILMKFGDLVKDFHIHVIFATNKAIAERPDALRGFLKGWFETIGFMRKNKAETVAIAKDVIDKDAEITAETYDALMPMFSDTGRFDPKALDVLAKSYVELKLLDKEPDPKQLYTEALLPAK